MLIGMLHHRKHPDTVTKSYAYAAVAKVEGAEMLYFTPRGVDLNENKINGYIYNNGQWESIKSDFPNVIYNTGSPEKLAISKSILDKLKEKIPFTTSSIGDKMRVYKRLEEAGEFIQYLVPSKNVYSIRQFFIFFNQFRKIVFKPVNGHKGQGIVFVENIRDQYRVLKNNESILLEYSQMVEYVKNAISNERYMVQPYINCKTKSGNSYDFRLHVQKNGDKEWTIVQIYPRIGPDGSIVSNINSGGSTNYLKPFLLQEFGEEYFNIKGYLEQFALQLAKHMDNLQMEKFSEVIDELGIDVGLDESGKIWIFEINWRPGCPPAFYLELDVVKNLIRYAISIANEIQIKSL